MVKILDLDHQMSNADVMNWVRQKRDQHKREDEEDRAAGITPSARPANFMKILDKTERHLMSDAYPYAKNPSAYEGENTDISIHKFGDKRFEAVQNTIYERYKDAIRKGLMTTAEAKDKMGAEMERKELTEPELLMIHNHAPKTVEMLEPMIEEVEERFSKEELQIIVDCICEVYRADELKASRKERKKAKKEAAKEAKKAEKAEKEGEAGIGEKTAEAERAEDEGVQMSSMSDAIREISPFSARPVSAELGAIDYGAPMQYRPLPRRERAGEPTGANAEELEAPNRLE